MASLLLEKKNVTCRSKMQYAGFVKLANSEFFEGRGDGKIKVS